MKRKVELNKLGDGWWQVWLRTGSKKDSHSSVHTLNFTDSEIFTLMTKWKERKS